MFKDIYLEIANYIITGATGINHVDWFNHQYEQSEDELLTAWKRPAVFIEFKPVQTVSLVNKRVQKAQIDLLLHLVTECYADPRQNSSSQAKALVHYDVMNKLYALLEGHNYKIEEPASSGNYRQVYNSLTRTAIEPDHNQTNLIVTIQTFTCLAFDFSAVKDIVKPPATPNLIISAG